MPSSPLLPLVAGLISAATARAPAPSCRCVARSAAASATVTASWDLHRARAWPWTCARHWRALAWSQVPARFTIQAPSSTISSSPPSRVRAPCRAHARTTPSGKAAPHGRRSHAAAPRSQVPSGTHQRSTCARIGRLGMVAASGKAAKPARRSCRQHRRAARYQHLLLATPGPSARFGRLSPRRVLPPWTPQPGHPPGARLLRKLAK